jgi:hypothetical protein
MSLWDVVSHNLSSNKVAHRAFTKMLIPFHHTTDITSQMSIILVLTIVRTSELWCFHSHCNFLVAPHTLLNACCTNFRYTSIDTFQHGEDPHHGLLVYDLCYMVGSYQCFRGNTASICRRLGRAGTSKTLVPVYQNTQHNISESCNHNKPYHLACDYQHLEQHTASIFRLEVNMQAVYPSKTSVPTYYIAYYHNLKDHNIKSSLLSDP